MDEHVEIDAGGVVLRGDLMVPARASGVVLFAHGSGSSRFSPRNRFVARVLQGRGLATLLVDLLTEREQAVDERTGQFRFDIELLAERLEHAIVWLRRQPATAWLPIGLFGASTGAGAALVAAARMPHDVAVVVSRGGRPDLAASALPAVKAPTLLVVGSRDYEVIALNQRARDQMGAEVTLRLVPNASHLFEEPGALDEVARLAAGWFVEQLARATANSAARAK